MVSNPASHLRHSLSTLLKNKRPIAVAGLCAAFLLIGLAVILARSSWQSLRAAKPEKPKLHVRAGALWPQLRWNLRALGDRLERPGKEQVLMQGTLTRTGVPAPAAVTLNLEAPNRLSLAMQSGIQSESIQFDGTASSRAALAPEEHDLVETLLLDSAETFFLEQARGAATRCLGFRFRDNAQNSAGPSHDIYAVMQSSSSTSNVRGAKLFYFNSDNYLLDSVRYEVERNGRPVQVVIKFSKWEAVADQQVARRIERWDDNTNVLTLDVHSVTFAPSGR